MGDETVTSILELFLRDCGEELDAAAIDDLRVAVRISTEFHDYLAKQDKDAAQTELEYVMNTIRSGIDSFFAVAFLARILEKRAFPDAGWGKDSDLDGLRTDYLARFKALPDVALGFEERLKALLGLCQSQLLFLAKNFTAIIDMSEGR